MKYLSTVLIAILVLFSESKVKAQGFSFTNLGPVYVQYPYYPDSIQVIKMQAIVSSQSSTPVNFRFARIVNDLPSGWFTQMCYDLCYAPFVDTISMPGIDPPYVLMPGQTDTLFYIDFSCVGQGLGTSLVKMFNTDNPSQYVIDTFKVQIGGVGISNLSSQVDGYELMQNYPNPFNPTTSIVFSIPSAENVTLNVYDLNGREVSTLLKNTRLSTGKYKADFDASNLSSGVYYYTISAGEFRSTRKMILVR